MSTPMPDMDLTGPQERPSLAVGPEGIIIARHVLRDLLARVEAADVTHEEAANALRTALAGLEGRG